MTNDGTMTPDQLAARLVDLLGDDVLSIVLYGSAAREQYVKGSSDLNVLVLLRAVDEVALRRCTRLAREWAQYGNPPPLLLADEEMRRSLDIFPIEYGEIREAHRVLHGSDPFSQIEIEQKYLRLQCERELKTALIQLRERYLLIADEPEEVGTLLLGSVTTFLVHYRTILRLEGDPIPADEADLVVAVASRAGFSPDPVLEALRARRANESLRVPAGDPTAVGYLEAAARAVAYVDALGATDR
jgi:hypothetical protein